MKPIIRDWLINAGLVLVGGILLVAAFRMQIAGKQAAEDAAKATSPVASK
jgi:hypothetical protein